ncbi:tetratricopeptide repeat protein [Methylocaldum szegediense]|uniref:tetratricopeptide repeat protein n=1 Tax=Methylocaldum szegediense TaxID=73780 RepID=UPI00138ABAA6|nr:tetratricopeptide repeat protein [Methylocaldum szegediense]
MRPLHLALVLLTFLLANTGHTKTGSDLHEAVRRLEDEWAEIFYLLPRSEQAEKFENLLARVHALSEQYPNEADPLILEAIVLCTYAGADIGLSSLSRVEKARKLLIKAIDINPRAMEASAYITLGNLYYRLPGWPISFGDTNSARQYLESALKLYPNAIDTNYFYGDFLLQEGEYDKALIYLEKAEKAPIRPYMRLSDTKLKEEIREALKAAREKRDGYGDFFSNFLTSLFGDDSEKP